ncbi:MAG: cobalt-precorrin-6A reductase [Kineosporiaceae bacterium]
MRVLILGGTGAGRVLADDMAGQPDLEVITSLAGRVTRPRLPSGSVRIGGFGGVDGLTDYLRATGIDRVVDATHPFAAQITDHAARACARTGRPLLVLRPPGWSERDGDRWQRVPDAATAARAVAASGPGVVLLTVGRQGLAAFAADTAHDYVIRTIDVADSTVALPHRHVLVLARGPFTLDGERALLRDHRISLLVTKDSGGPATIAKLTAARELGLPVVMIDRPPLPPGVGCVPTAADAADWITAGRAPRDGEPSGRGRGAAERVQDGDQVRLGARPEAGGAQPETP